MRVSLCLSRILDGGRSWRCMSCQRVWKVLGSLPVGRAMWWERENSGTPWSVIHISRSSGIPDSFLLLLPADCDRYGYGHGKRFATLNPDPADHGSSPFISSLIRGHTSTIRTTCLVLLDAFYISLLVRTNTSCARFHYWG